MTITKTTPSEPTGTKLTEYIFTEAFHIWKDEGGSFSEILRERFGVLDFNPYEHYYGFNKPID